MPQAYNRPWVEARVAQAIELWQRCDAPLPLPERLYSQKDQQERELACGEAVTAVEQEARKASRGRAGRLAIQDRVVDLFVRVAGPAFGLEADAIALIRDRFLPLGAEFARSARRFDRSLSMADIVQACRNAWTACGLQPMLGERMELTPSILGYSLLYPYSDNYLDCRRVSAEAKLRFSKRFRSRLRGEELSPANDREAAIWAAVALIERQYPHKSFPQVYDSLLAIHQAQEESIAQLGGNRRCGDAEILRISCAKGGTSVLANACLCRGWLEEQEELLSFEMGLLLQLGDDLQDLRNDLRLGSATLFTAAVLRGASLDSLVAQLLNLHERVATRLEFLPQGSPVLRRLLRTSWRSLILGAVAQAREFFSPGFLSELEASSPLRFAFLRDRNRRLASRKSLYSSLFEAFLETPEDSEDKTSLPVTGQLLYGILQ